MAILSALSKVFEKLVHEAIGAATRQFIAPWQHGFVRHRSTTSNLVATTNFIIQSIEDGHQVDAIYTDFSKAFDRVRHSVFMRKLERIGFHGPILRWIGSYLSGRRQQVLINNFLSKFITVTSGVIQGSHLGPLLFIIFLNDIADSLTSMNLAFADDFKMLRQIKTNKDATEFQEEIKKFSSWCATNAMELNIDKCCVISFYRKRTPITFEYAINDQPINRTSTVKDLGIFLDHKLSFNAHIDYVITRSYGLLGFLQRICANVTNVWALKSVYTSLVRSTLEYGSVVWQPYHTTHINRIESIQRKFVRFVFRHTDARSNFRLPPYHPRRAALALETLENRRRNALLFFLYDLLNEFIDAPELRRKLNISVAPRPGLRHTRTFLPSSHRTLYGRMEPISRMMEEFNEVSASDNSYRIFGVNRGTFRSHTLSLVR